MKALSFPSSNKSRTENRSCYASHFPLPTALPRRPACSPHAFTDRQQQGLGTNSKGDSESTAQPSSPQTLNKSMETTTSSRPLSPAGFLPSASGISVNGYSPTSLQGWTIIKQTLNDAKVKVITAQEVVFAQERGVPVLDVRPADQYEKGHIPGSFNVPFYQPIQGWDAVKAARRIGYALFGVFNGTEVNPRFTEQAEEVIDPELGAVLVCSIGGTVDPTEGSKKGLQSRSLIAAWQLVTGGSKNLSILRGGMSEWASNGRDIAMMVDEGEDS